MILYYDFNGDGDVDAGDPRVATTVTDASGAYLFDQLPAGSYVVDVTDQANQLAGYWHSLGALDTNDNSQSDPYAVSLLEGENVVTADFGYYVELASIGNYVWFDANADGIQQGTEPGLDSVEVTLTIDYPNGSQSVLTTLTDSNGLYSFDNLLADEDYNGDPSDGSPEPVFTLMVATPQTGDGTPMRMSPINQGGDDEVDSDNPASEVAHPVQGRVDNSNDFGYYGLGSISGNVSEDINRNGIVDPEDGPLPNIVITVYEDMDQDGLADDLNNDGVIDANDIAEDVNGNALTALTNVDGNYSFEDVPPGSYVVQEQDPAGYESILDGDITNPGDDMPANADIEDNLIPVTLIADSVLMMAEEDDGNNFVDSPLLAGLGDLVWLDANANGIQDAGEDGIENVTVTLLDSNGDPQDTALTDGVGFYEFTELVAQTYTVVVDESTLPSDVEPTHDYDDPVTTTPVTPNEATVTIVPGEYQDEVDFGYRQTNGAITGSVTQDTTGDGMGDIPISTEVQLFEDIDGDGQPDGASIATVPTDPADGSYIFSDVPEGNYVVIEVQPTELVDISDQDTVPDGDSFDGDATVDNLIAVTVTKNETDTGNDFVDARTGNISGSVTEDTTGDGQGDTPIQGVMIELFKDTNGNGDHDGEAGADGVIGTADDEPLLMTTTTDPNGNYSFEDLLPGDYAVVETQPTDVNGDPYISVRDEDEDTAHIGDPDPQDSDTTVDDNIGVTLNPGETDVGNNFVEQITQPGETICVPYTTDSSENWSIFVREYYSVSNGQFIIDPINGSAIFSGTAVNSNDSFEFELIFSGHTTVPPPGSPVYVIPGVDTSNWEYYTELSGFFGPYTVSIEGKPAAQYGVGANNHDRDQLGLSVWFNYYLNGQLISTHGDVSIRINDDCIDYGDAPASYGDASHTLDETNFLGNLADSEAASQYSDHADGDDTDVLGDDEDGVSISMLSINQPTTIPVTVTGSGTLNAWMDFDGDGSFDNDEQIAIDVPASGITNLAVIIPADAVTTEPIFARFRLGSAGIGATGVDSFGEVEDYQFQIVDSSCIDPAGTDSDGDGINDACDLDDDNDGVPDIDENTCAPTRAVSWFHNLAQDNNSNSAFVPYNTAPAYRADLVNNTLVSNAANLVRGRGVTVDQAAQVIGNPVNQRMTTMLGVDEIDQLTLTDAKTDDDYIQYTFTTASSLDNYSLVRVRHSYYTARFNGYGYTAGDPIGGSLQYALEISNDGFVSDKTLIVSPRDDGNASGLDELIKIDVLTGVDKHVFGSNVHYLLVANTTYSIRMYLFSESNGRNLIDDIVCWSSARIRILMAMASQTT